MLEVGNFDPVSDPPVVSPPQSGYYMLDLQNFDQDGSSKVTAAEPTEPKRSSSAAGYENIIPSRSGSTTPHQGSKVGSPEAGLSPEKRTAEDQSAPTSSHDGIQRATVYENVIISALGVPEPVVPVEHPYNVPPPKPDIPSVGAEPPLPPRPGGRGLKAEPVEDESGYTLVDESSRKKLGASGIVVSAKLPDCYEECNPKTSQSQHQSSQAGSSSQTGSEVSSVDRPLSPNSVVPQSLSSPSKRTSLRRREDIYESVKVGGADSSKSQPSSVPHMNGLREGPERDLAQSSSPETSSTLEGTSIIDNSRDNPFAGLVLSASRQLEESVTQSSGLVGDMEREGDTEAGGRFRGRIDTVWDDIRMEKEWTQVLCIWL